MATIQQQYKACILAHLRNGLSEQAARAVCHNQFLRIQQREQARRGLPVTTEIDLSDDMQIERPADSAEPIVPGLLVEAPVPVRGRPKKKA